MKIHDSPSWAGVPLILGIVERTAVFSAGYFLRDFPVFLEDARMSFQ